MTDGAKIEFAEGERIVAQTTILHTFGKNVPIWDVVFNGLARGFP